MTRPPAGDPFRALGLERRADLTDDDVRSAWRRTAAATHPDRSDGGDPAAFALAAAAYTVLRSRAGRGEALADLMVTPGGSGRRRPPGRWHQAGHGPDVTLLMIRIRRGRPVRLGLRVLAAAAVCALSVAGAGWQPASAAIITGALTWLGLTGRADVAEPPA